MTFKTYTYIKNYKGKLNSVFIKYYKHSKISFCPGETFWDEIHCGLKFVIKEMNIEDILFLCQY